MITDANLTGQGTSSLNHVPANISSGPPSVQARTTWPYNNDMAAHHEFSVRCPLNWFSRAEFRSNNDAGTSNQETLLFSQHTYQGLGQHDPSMPQNGIPDYPPQGNSVLNDQGSFSAQPTIPSHILLPPLRDDMITGASLTGQGITSLDHVPVDIFSAPPSDEFDDCLDELLALVEYEADQGIAPTNNGEVPNSNNQPHGYEHDGGNQ